MKNHLFNLLSSVIAFYIPFQLALLTDLILVKNLIILIFCIQWISFIPAYYFQTEKFFDLMGSITYISIILSTIYITGTDKIADYIIVGCVAVWAIRLGSFLFMRIHKAGEDRRFRTIKINFTRFLMTWTLQGMWVSMCLLCVLTALSSYNGIIINNVFYIGLVMFILGFAIEVIADRQKTNFRKKSENKDKFISTGLWALSRHPNYFGEILFWWGIYIISIGNNTWFIGITSPVVVTYLLTRFSGVPMLEKRYKDNDHYLKYIRSTNTLIPGPKKRI